MSADPPQEAGASGAVEPLAVDGVAAMIAGTALWACGLVLLLLLGVRPSDPHGWWLGVSLAGMFIGGIGIRYTRRRASGQTRS